mgnify:CR=1 FL=1
MLLWASTVLWQRNQDKNLARKTNKRRKSRVAQFRRSHSFYQRCRLKCLSTNFFLKKMDDDIDFLNLSRSHLPAGTLFDTSLKGMDHSHHTHNSHTSPKGFLRKLKIENVTNGMFDMSLHSAMDVTQHTRCSTENREPGGDAST